MEWVPLDLNESYWLADEETLARHPKAREIVETVVSAGIRIALAESKTVDPRAKELLRSTLRITIPSESDTRKVLGAITEALDKYADIVV